MIGCPDEVPGTSFRRLVKPLGLDGWEIEVPNAVDAFAAQHHVRGPGGP